MDARAKQRLCYRTGRFCPVFPHDLPFSASFDRRVHAAMPKSASASTTREAARKCNGISPHVKSASPCQKDTLLLFGSRSLRATSIGPASQLHSSAIYLPPPTDSGRSSAKTPPDPPGCPPKMPDIHPCRCFASPRGR